MPAHRPAEIRFWEKVAKAGLDDCWLWTAAVQSRGYGMFHVSQWEHTTAHRFAWELANGPVPEGLSVLHRCDVRLCANVRHLFLGTARDNTQDMIEKRRDSPPPHIPGEANVRSRLTDEAVRSMRERFAAGEIVQHLANEFGVNSGTAWRAIHRQTWRHVA